ncbi:hypothetical protein GCM10027035_12690 [Emticicia sediminis]
MPESKNVIKLEYDGSILNFYNVKIEETSDLDLDGGLGLRAYGELNFTILNKDSCCNYYVILDFKKGNNNSVSPHKINFGIKRSISNDNFFQKLYYANLTNTFNYTNFFFNIKKERSNIDGIFYGKLITPFEKDSIEVTNGTYFLELDTIRNY